MSPLEVVKGDRESEPATIDFPNPHERTPTILLVDSEALVRMALASFLQGCGFKVLQQVDAESAIAAITAYVVPLDLVLSDVRLSGAMDGFALAQWVRANCAGLPVVLCSGDPDKARTAHELCAGEPFLTKPYDFAHVLAQIRQRLKK
jgi:DNA-binding response OmpR family regulator